MSSKPFRIEPSVNLDNEHFWRGGKNGTLCFLSCCDCETLIHPPQPICPNCLSKKLEPKAVSGNATVYSYTVNRHAWIPGFDPPYVVALVEIAEDPKIRLMTNIVNCAIEAVTIGMAVKVCFEPLEHEIYLPLFEPR